MTRTLYRLHELPLVLGASAGYPSGDDLALLGYEPVQQAVIFVIDVKYAVLAKSTDFLAAD